MYSFVGITQDWNVVLFGDESKLIEEGSTARGIAPISTSSRRSLFQDIFGKSAFADSSIIPSLLDSPTHLWTGKEAINAFDSPAYLMPSLGSLYDPIIDGFLKPRREILHDDSVVEAGDEDVEMDEESAVMAFAGTRRHRKVSGKEVDTFIELFRKHSIQCKSLFYPECDTE